MPCGRELEDPGSIRPGESNVMKNPFWELLTKDGEPLLSHNHICLLNGLYDRPGGKVRSRADWVRATLPYLRQVNPHPSVHCLMKSIPTMQSAWITHSRDGRQHVWTLTQRGRDIVERKVRSRVRGFGSYEGFKALVRVAHSKSR
jgi:hypothetical protein